MHTTLKIAGLSIITFAFTAGTALAGPDKNCDDKKKTAMQTTATAIAPTAVLSAADSPKVMTKKAKKTYSFEDALKLCQEKGAADLQACVDYKTGVTGAKS